MMLTNCDKIDDLIDDSIKHTYRDLQEDCDKIFKSKWSQEEWELANTANRRQRSADSHFYPTTHWTTN